MQFSYLNKFYTFKYSHLESVVGFSDVQQPLRAGNM